jgi:hypothetical protein
MQALTHHMQTHYCQVMSSNWQCKVKRKLMSCLIVAGVPQPPSRSGWQSSMSQLSVCPRTRQLRFRYWSSPRLALQLIPSASQLWAYVCCYPSLGRLTGASNMLHVICVAGAAAEGPRGRHGGGRRQRLAVPRTGGRRHCRGLRLGHCHRGESVCIGVWSAVRCAMCRDAHGSGCWLLAAAATNSTCC